MKPLVTVITVCFNCKADIEKTIKSVLGQTYDNIEYLIIDGGSIDGTVDVIKTYSDRLAYWVSEPDRGIYDAMNKGLQKANGEWVNFMNVGDLFVDERVVADVFSNQISDELKVIYGNTVNDYGREKSIHHAEPASVLKDRLAFSHQACFVKTKNFKWNFDTAYKFAADYNLFYSILFEYGESAFFNTGKEIAQYKNEGSFTFQHLKEVKLEYLKIRSAHKNFVWFKDFIKFKFGL